VSGPAVKVLAVMGSGRAGSTLLDMVLGSIDSFFSAGELRYVWESDAAEPRCGCGELLSSCSVWQAVIYGSSTSGRCLADLGLARVRRLQSELGRTRHTRSLLLADTRPSYRTDLRDYLAAMNALYARIGEVTGASVIVDSSKRPSDAALLRLLPNVDPYVVHLVRDPRAVAYSWQRSKADPGAADRTDGRMPNRSAVLSTGVWVELNGVGQLVRRHFGPDRSLLVRYEDFVARPRRTVAGILAMLDVVADPPVSHDGITTLASNHTVGGNPNRFTHGPIQIRPDDDWRERLAMTDSWTCSALAAPLNAIYGYPIRPRVENGRATARSNERASR